MTRAEALSLLGEYCERLHNAGAWVGTLGDAVGMAARFPEDGSEAKAMRWLGYMQGVLVASGVYSLDEVKEHSRRKWVVAPDVQEARRLSKEAQRLIKEFDTKA